VAAGTYLGPFVRFGAYRYADLEELVPENGTAFQTGLVLRYDTRDNPRFPRSGTALELRPAFGLSHSDEDSTAGRVFHQVALDLRRYTSLYWCAPGRRERPAVLAMRATATLSTTDTPQHSLPAMGGLQLLRGYPANRFTARHMMTFQGELRFLLTLSDRLALVAFGGAGVAQDTLSRLLTSELHFSGGGGVRLALNRDGDVNLRLDAGFSPEGSRIYITLMEAF
jgi:outer membrane protein assembly factor BamA